MSEALPERRGPWTVTARREIYRNPWVRLVEHEVITPGGARSIYGTVHPVRVATGVVAIDDQGRVPLVGQHRFPLDAWSWEVPEGGTDPGETPEAAIRRELAEETGYTAAHWRPILTLHTSNMLSDETAHGFLATGLTPGTPKPDDDEALQMRLVPFAEALAMAESGAITDAISVALLFKVARMAAAGELPRAETRAMGF